jgi:hypothetical protein
MTTLTDTQVVTASGGLVMAHVRFTAISANELFRMEHASSNTGAAAYAWGRTLTATPIRVKA